MDSSHEKGRETLEREEYKTPTCTQHTHTIATQYRGNEDVKVVEHEK